MDQDHADRPAPFFFGLHIVIPEETLEEEGEGEGGGEGGGEGDANNDPTTPHHLMQSTGTSALLNSPRMSWSRASLLRSRGEDVDETFTRDVRRRTESVPYQLSPPQVCASSSNIEADPIVCTVETLCESFRVARARNAEIAAIDQEYTNRDELLSASYSRLESELTMFCAFSETQHDSIHEMLADSFRTARERLRESVLEKTRDRAEVSERVEAYRKFMLAGLQEFVPPEQVNTHVCPVCFVEQVNMSFYPCGHAFCQQCSVRVRLCPVCKTHVQGRNRLFFAI